MLPQKNSVKIVLFLAAWTVLLFGFIKLQNDSIRSRNMLQSNEERLVLNHFEGSTNQEKDIHLKSTTYEEQITTTVKSKFNPQRTTTKLPEMEESICNVSRPHFGDLQFDNIYWQTLNTTNGTIKVFRAFYDDRKESAIGPSIRIIAMINRIEIQNVTTYCQFWFNDVEKPIVSEIIEYKLIWYKPWKVNKIYLPFLITCPYDFKEHKKIPDGVSLVNKNCDQTDNYLKVLNIRPEMNVEKKPFAVCVKDFNYDDQNQAIRLIEWIELVRILGADKIFIYQFHATGNIRKVFDYYERYGILEIVKLSYPQNQTLDNWTNELISLNDCFYRNIYLYDYIALIDIDEIIIPMHPDDMSWLDMFERIFRANNEHYASYIFPNIYFLDDFQHNHTWHLDIPQYLHILQHTIRSINYTSKIFLADKAFHSTTLVKTVFNHFPFSCITNNENCINVKVDSNFGHLAHYRRACRKGFVELCKYFLNHTVEDKTVWKYKDKLISQSNKVINMLKLIKDDKNLKT